MNSDLDRTLDSVGPRLRALRQKRETTLADLSEATGISLSTLSRLESGTRKPTLELLLPLARAHGVSLDDLVDDPPAGDPRVHLKPVMRHGMTMLPLSQKAEGIQAYKLVLPAVNPERRPKMQAHDGYEWLYVLDGSLHLMLGKHDLVLSRGEAAEFDTRVPHFFEAAGGEPAEILSMFGTQGERAHLRVRSKPKER